MKKRTIVLIHVLLLLAACEQKIIRPTVPFDQVEIERALKPGNYTISGQAFAKTQSGNVKYGAGNTITLLPLTAYIKQVFALQGQKDAFTHVEVDKRILDYARKTTADAEGRFKFSNLSPGEYYIETTISWLIQTPYGKMETGDTVKATVNLTGDMEVILH